MDEPVWIGRSAVDRIHARLIDEYGGSHGVRDPGLVDSALARPVNRWSYEGGADVFELAAAYGYGLARNHGFIDGNKRIVFATMAISLDLNGYDVIAAPDEATSNMIGVASGSITEAELAAWLRSHAAEVG